MKKIYRLVYEDLTHLGGPMGTEYTTYSHMGTYSAPKTARAEAAKNYARKSGKVVKALKWYKESPTHFRTDDLLFVMYHIYEDTVE